MALLIRYKKLSLCIKNSSLSKSRRDKTVNVVRAALLFVEAMSCCEVEA